MINYYFFRLHRERNLQGELRAVLHALPGQYTYDPETRGFAAVNTNLKVQVPLATNAVVVRSSTGDIFGTEISGSTNNRARLPLYSRNDDKFYRAETLVKAENFSPTMQAAFEQLMGAGTPVQDAPAAADAPAPQAAEAVRPDMPETLAPSQMLSSKRFIDAVAGENGADTTLTLSRLHDKMMLGVVKFSYRKSSDDSVREAYGTLNRDIIARLRDDDDDSSRNRSEADGSHFFYFDIEKKAFRNFCTENFLSFENCIYNASVETVNEAA